MSEWLILHCERALYVDRGRTVILCDRLPNPVTLVVRLAAQGIDARQRHDREAGHGPKDESPVGGNADAPEGYHP